jgi:uncharacterized protein (DUF433 family)
MTATEHEAALIDRYLEADPADPDPAAWRLKERAVPVWAIIGALTEARDNLSQVAVDYGVSAQSIAAALVYYRHHGCLIDARLATNAA